MIWSYVGVAAAVLTMFGFIPQVIKMYQTKVVADVSRMTLYQFFLGTGCWIVYGIHLHDTIIVSANVITNISVLIGLCQHFYYSRKPTLDIGRNNHDTLSSLNVKDIPK